MFIVPALWMTDDHYRTGSASRAYFMRVLLVYTNRARNMVPAPPIGLSYVATATRRAGHHVRFLDLMVSRAPLADLKTALREFLPDVIGFSIRNIDNIIAQKVAWHLTEVRELIALVRRYGDARIVVGGPAVSIMGAGTLKNLNADFAIVGEGEIAFPRLLVAIGGSRDFARVSGLCYRQNGKVLSVPPERQEKFGRSGMEEWIRWGPYERAGGTWALHTKRGCPLSCIYCNYPVMEGNRLRSRSASDVVDEMEHVMAEVGPRTFEFTDSTFNVPESHAIGICQEIIRRKLRVNLSAVSVNPLAVSLELFSVMKRAGFCSLVITPDSASETMLKNLRKGFGVEHVRRVVELVREANVQCTWFFLLGGPGETKQTVEETVSFAETHLNSKKFVTIFLTGMRLLPGTPLTERAIAEGYLSADRDLSEPVFYLSPQVNEQWIINRVNQAIAHCPTIVHGAEQNGPVLERVFNRALYWMGFAPPYYRFLCNFLRIPPLPALRARNTNVRASCRKAQNAN
jgi:radical SAM superfamily enzyme YgiQ (UPF0313 family)